MRYVFIINPVAGKDKNKEKLSEAIKNFFKEKDLEYSIYFSNYRGNITKIAKCEAEKGDDVTIFACGGEGTSFEVLNGIY
ncbi:MAG: acylglycerol kinase family protein, partial [Clostridia bacterium]|nr:acylglycerol kinase family protein [Clostridia bacterium]